MSAAALFRPNGDEWSPVPQAIDDLPRPTRRAASEVWLAIMDLLPRIETDSRAITTRALAGVIGRSTGSVRKGLHTLRDLGLIRIDRPGPRQTITIKPGLLDEPRWIRRGGGP
jgi:hypothetical protein